MTPIIWLALGGCDEGGDALRCCSRDGDLGWTDEATCADLGGAPVEDDVCDGIPTDRDFPSESDEPATREALCADFCEAEQQSCPSDVECLHSCEEACPTGPTPADIDCATTAAAGGVGCSEFDCWGFCS